MKHLKIFFLLLVLHNIATLAQPINHSQALANLIPTKKWFEIENYYQQHKDSIDKVFVTPWYLAETARVFNRPFEAINAYEQLINKNPLNMDILGLTSLFGIPLLQLYSDEQEYTKRENLCQKLMTKLENDTIVDSNMRLAYLQWLIQSNEGFKLFPKTQIKLTITKNKVDSLEKTNLIPNEQGMGNGIFFNAKWNGINLKTCFDTGAGGCYVYNRTVAEKIGIKLNTTDTVVMNNGNIRSLRGVVDSLEFGKFIIRNVLVYVNVEQIDSAKPNQTICDSITNSQFDIVLGIPVIRRLGVIEFDFANNAMSFPTKSETVDKRNLYIENYVLYMNMEICNSNFSCFFDTGAMGHGLVINNDFYEKNKECISTEAETIKVSDVSGGCNEANWSYKNINKCPKIDIKINGQAITMENNCSVAKGQENDNNSSTVESGFLGNAIFKYCKKVIFDFDNMVFSIEK